MDFLVDKNATVISEKATENSLGQQPQKPRSDSSKPGAEEPVFPGSDAQSSIFSATMGTATFDLSKTNIGGSELLQDFSRQKIASRLNPRPKFGAIGSTSTIFETHSSFETTPGGSPTTSNKLRAKVNPSPIVIE